MTGGATPEGPLGCVLEAVFGKRRHLRLVQKLYLLKVHELLLVLDVGIVGCQIHQVVYLLNETVKGNSQVVQGMVRSVV